MERIAQVPCLDSRKFARAQAITAGTVYAPSGTVSQDWNVEFGWTRTTVNFALTTGSTEVLIRLNK